MTRMVQNPQLSFGATDISAIKFNPKSRDDIPKILRGLQYIYITPSLKEQVFSILETRVAPEISKNTGRPGMELWKILVMGVLRLDLNCDYDRLHELVNNHNTIRQMLGHGAGWEDDSEYQLQTIKDNVHLLSPELLEEINVAIVRAGHELVKKKENEVLRGRCDSFVVETNVHYPTDINLLYDAIRKVIQLTAQLCDNHGLSEWRQSVYNIKQVKRLMRIAQKKKRGSGKTAQQIAKQEQALKDSHKDYVMLAQRFLDKAQTTIKTLEGTVEFTMSDLPLVEGITQFSDDVIRQVDQIERRVLQGEVIPHEEKVFSVFQPHTEWVCKGKAGVPVELGLRVCVLEDQHQFILHHQVMEKKVDVEVAVSMVTTSKNHFSELSSCSFDKGFHSLENQKELKKKLEVVGLKRKGKLSQKSKAIEDSEDFKKACDKHSAVESAINGLEVHGLDVCRDHGIHGFKRYVALAVVARNLHRIGDILHKKVQKNLIRKSNRSRDGTFKQAA